MTLTPGTKLGPYEILTPIGSGGMGEVWKARNTRQGRIVAIKKIKEQHSESFSTIRLIRIRVNRRLWRRDSKRLCRSGVQLCLCY
jgi:serine/threonine protein kinase